MSVPTSTALTLPPPAADRLTTRDTGARSGPTPGAERAKLAELAAQFESMLMLEMIKQMRRSLLDDGEQEAGLGNETYSSTIDSELAQHLARAGGLGLQPTMLEAWDRQTATGSVAAATPRSAPGVSAAPAAVAPPAVSVVRRSSAVLATAPDGGVHAPSLEMAARVSSGYGWRADPIKGTGKFHGGIDLAASYGTDVPAAAEGTVAVADEQGAYGLTVVVRHASGYETRYAHLSSLGVRPGDAVARGQMVGRVGSTGRSTGPHLHFEVTQAGRRVDPERFVSNLTSDTKGQ